MSRSFKNKRKSRRTKRGGYCYWGCGMNYKDTEKCNTCITDRIKSANKLIDFFEIIMKSQKIGETDENKKYNTEIVECMKKRLKKLMDEKSFSQLVTWDKQYYYVGNYFQEKKFPGDMSFESNLTNPLKSMGGEIWNAWNEEWNNKQKQQGGKKRRSRRSRKKRRSRRSRKGKRKSRRRRRRTKKRR